MPILPSFSSSNHENPSMHFCTGAFPQVIIEPPSPKGCYRTEREMLKYEKNPLSQKKKKSVLCILSAGLEAIMIEVYGSIIPSYKYLWDNSITINPALT